jgi:hypothetical protein
MHLNGDSTLCLPFSLLKILSKMSKRIQKNPSTTGKSIFHERIIKTLIMYVLGEFQSSWDWLIESLNIEEQESKHKNTLKHK